MARRMIPLLLLFSLLSAADIPDPDALAQGRVGVAVLVVEDQAAAPTIHGDGRYPMQSVYKFPIAMAVLHEVDRGRLSLDARIRVGKEDYVTARQHSPIRDAHPEGGAEYPLRELIRLNVAESDGTACDVLLRLLGGPRRAQQYLHRLGIDGIRIETTEKEMGLDDKAQYRNWARPAEMVRLLRLFQQGRGLSAAGRDLLLRMMIESPTGPRRLKGLLPPGAVVAHKTGSSGTRDGVAAATNDAGLITLPDGRHLAIAVFVADARAGEEVRDRVIAEQARFWYDKYAGAAR